MSAHDDFARIQAWNDTELEKLARLAESTADLDDIGDYGGGEIVERWVVSNWIEVVRAVLRAVGRADLADQPTVWETDFGKRYRAQAGVRQ